MDVKILFLIVSMITVPVCNGGEISKRNIVSRFSSNPFFLSHFSPFNSAVNYDYNYYPSIVEDYNEDYEELDDDEDEGVFDKNIELSGADQVEENSKTQELGHFNQLPLFEIGEIFQENSQFLEEIDGKPKVLNIEDKNSLETVKENHPDGGFIYLFRSLPHFHKNSIFNRPSNLKEKTQSGKLLTTSQTSRSDIPIEENSQHEITNEMLSNENHFPFKTLPLFDYPNTFNKIDNKLLISEENISPINLQQIIENPSIINLEENDLRKSHFDAPKNAQSNGIVYESQPLAEIFTSSFAVTEKIDNFLTETLPNLHYSSTFKKIDKTPHLSQENPTATSIKFVSTIKSVTEIPPLPPSRKPLRRRVVKLLRRKIPSNIEHNIQFLAPSQKKLLPDPDEDVSQFFEKNYGRKLPLAQIPLGIGSADKDSSTNSYGDLI